MTRATRQNGSATRKLVFDVPVELKPYGGAAITRLGYLFGDVRFTHTGNQILAEAEHQVDEGQLRKEISHALYREKIYQETLPARLSIIRALTQI